MDRCDDCYNRNNPDNDIKSHELIVKGRDHRVKMRDVVINRILEYSYNLPVEIILHSE